MKNRVASDIDSANATMSVIENPVVEADGDLSRIFGDGECAADSAEYSTEKLEPLFDDPEHARYGDERAHDIMRGKRSLRVEGDKLIIG